ncbi:MAG TPA: hypothetical protein RMH99_29485 [Sandaracinaceae bacterium LLY-WYZ-13_1]|nr:hypothetical protein [Sandaracinaceae bacterium LLY-WYZ-13_1]
MRRAAVGGLGLAVILLSAASADAQPEGEPPEAYREAILGAVEEFQAGRWSEARALFLRAHEIMPNARTFRGIGLASFEMREYAEAHRALTRALADERRPLSDEHRAHARELLERCRTFTGRYALAITPSDAEVELQLDGAPVEPHGGVLVVNIGTHTLVATAPGFEPRTRRLSVRGGEEASLRLALEATVGGTAGRDDGTGERGASSGAGAAVVPPDGSGAGAEGPVVALVAGAVLAAGAAGAGVYWNDREEQLGACGDCGSRPSLWSERDWARGVTLGAVGAGATALALGVLWLALEGDAPARAVPALVVAGVGLASGGIGIGLTAERGDALAACEPISSLCLNERVVVAEQTGAQVLASVGLGVGAAALALGLLSLAMDGGAEAEAAVSCGPGAAGVRCAF